MKNHSEDGDIRGFKTGMTFGITYFIIREYWLILLWWEGIVTVYSYLQYLTVLNPKL